MNAVKNFFRASAEDFKKIPGSPVAYWVSKKGLNAFNTLKTMENIAHPKVGMQTSNNDKYLRLWYEICYSWFSGGNTNGLPKWIKYVKGGPYRKWYGNLEYLLFYNSDPTYILQQKNARVLDISYLSKPKCTWTDLTSGKNSFRYVPDDTFYDISGHCFFPEKSIQLCLLANSNSIPFISLLKIINSSFHCQVGDVAKIPVPELNVEKIEYINEVAILLVKLSKSDWDSYETSWDFKVNPLIELSRGGNDLSLTTIYDALRRKWLDDIAEMRRLETENNRIFIEAYGLQDELTPEVPWHEITLTCNPWYRYGKKAPVSEGFPIDAELEERFKADTVKELISYAVGCMMGRYSLDKPGLVLANQHQTLNSELSTLNSNFSPDSDGIIPVLDDDCFADDIVTQFHRFLRTAFGDRNFNENLNFIEDALGKDIRSYFVKDFYPEHLQRYQKRPIYWLFSSPKGTFSALTYMHRYNPGTVGQVLTYLRSHITKIQSRVDAADRTTADSAATQGMKSRAIKERAKLVRQLKELEDYERDVLHPLASKRVEIDLDDGVKTNYPKFGAALRKIPGMAKES